MRFASHAGFFASARLLGRGLKETGSDAALRKPAGRTVRRGNAVRIPRRLFASARLFGRGFKETGGTNSPPGKNAIRIPRRLFCLRAPVGARPQRNRFRCGFKEPGGTNSPPGKCGSHPTQAFCLSAPVGARPQRNRLGRGFKETSGVNNLPGKNAVRVPRRLLDSARLLGRGLKETGSGAALRKPAVQITRRGRMRFASRAGFLPQRAF